MHITIQIENSDLNIPGIKDTVKELISLSKANVSVSDSVLANPRPSKKKARKVHKKVRGQLATLSNIRSHCTLDFLNSSYPKYVSGIKIGRHIAKFEPGLPWKQAATWFYNHRNVFELEQTTEGFRLVKQIEPEAIV